MHNARMKGKYFIRVTSVSLFNVLVDATERTAPRYDATFVAQRSRGYYEIGTDSIVLWQEIYLYGQFLAQAQDEFIDGGERAE
jgi:hypothetical protein